MGLPRLAAELDPALAMSMSAASAKASGGDPVSYNRVAPSCRERGKGSLSLHPPATTIRRIAPSKAIFIFIMTICRIADLMSSLSPPIRACMIYSMNSLRDDVGEMPSRPRFEEVRASAGSKMHVCTPNADTDPQTDLT
eukprot:scaffold16688_cov40-Prasinocladus_malaysianus.AAC.1